MQLAVRHRVMLLFEVDWRRRVSAMSDCSDPRGDAHLGRDVHLDSPMLYIIKWYDAQGAE